MVKLYDVGKEVEVLFDRPVGYKATVKVEMGIVAPNGESMFLFESGYMYTPSKCHAIQLFMSQHRHDKHK